VISDKMTRGTHFGIPSPKSAQLPMGARTLHNVQSRPSTVRHPRDIFHDVAGGSDPFDFYFWKSRHVDRVGLVVGGPGE
jgi:hypothetical protein